MDKKFTFDIVVGDLDQGYSDNLSIYLMTSNNHNFSVKSFSNSTHLVHFLKKGKIDILLITPEMYNKINYSNDNVVIILLVDELIETGFKSLPLIYKYQQGNSIVQQIITHYTKNSTKELLNTRSNHKSASLIGVYSPCGGCGKTTISYMMGKCLAQQNKKTLLISLEEFASHGDNMSITSDKSSISDLFYYIKKKVDNLAMKLESIIETDPSGLTYIPPPNYYEDMKALDIKEWQSFLQYLINHSWYEYIIIDFTSEFSERNNFLLSICDYPILLSNLTKSNQYKIHQFISTINKLDQEYPLIKLVANNNLQLSNLSERLIWGEEISIFIPYNQAIEIGELNSENEFGRSIITLVEGILKSGWNN